MRQISLGRLIFSNGTSFELAATAGSPLGAVYSLRKKRKIIESCLYTLVQNAMCITEPHWAYVSVTLEIYTPIKKTNIFFHSFEINTQTQPVSCYIKNPKQWPAYLSNKIVSYALGAIYTKHDAERSKQTQLFSLKDGLLPGTCPVCPRKIGDLNKNKLGEYAYYGCSKKHSLGVTGQYLYQKEIREQK